ncbi:hypothetical protein [Halobaculum sp. EA56]|uniref:hypothetical protein n=1 Tax=Halobaculum sp. EA56 TaxID=3421648 RepID=UPI003EBDE75E
MKQYGQESDGERGSTTERTRTTTVDGDRARIGTDPSEIYIELRLGSPAYIHVREGDYLQEGDPFRRERVGADAPTLDTWEVTEITPETVVARDLDTDEAVTMDRETVERRLATGEYSTNLTDFEWVSVYQVGDWDEYDPEGDRDDADTRYTGRPYVSVVAYGDNGLKYGRRYRFVEPDSTEVYLWKEDRPLRGFDGDVEDLLDRRIRAALEADGYAVVERGDEPG